MSLIELSRSEWQTVAKAAHTVTNNKGALEALSGSVSEREIADIYHTATQKGRDGDAGRFRMQDDVVSLARTWNILLAAEVVTGRNGGGNTEFVALQKRLIVVPGLNILAHSAAKFAPTPARYTEGFVDRRTEPRRPPTARDEEVPPEDGRKYLDTRRQLVRDLYRRLKFRDDEGINDFLDAVGKLLEALFEEDPSRRRAAEILLSGDQSPYWYNLCLHATGGDEGELREFLENPVVKRQLEAVRDGRAPEARLQPTEGARGRIEERGRRRGRPQKARR